MRFSRCVCVCVQHVLSESSMACRMCHSGEVQGGISPAKNCIDTVEEFLVATEATPVNQSEV